MDSNTFTLTCPEIVSMTYLANSFVVTSGQSASPPPTFTKNGNTWTASIGANRKGSSAVANSFNGKTGGSLHNYTNSSGDKSPEELNFYFGVTATFNVSGSSEPVPVTFYLGQGHYSFNNNWWLGGNMVLYSGGDPLFNVISGGSILATYKISGSGNSSMTLNAD